MCYSCIKNMHTRKSQERGVTLIELLVIIAIITVMATVEIISLSSSTLSVKTSTSAENVLNLIKETRQRSLAVKELRSTGLFPNYGVYFDIASPDTVIVYADCVSDDNDSGAGDGILNDQDNFTYPSTPPDNCTGGNLVRTFTLTFPIVIQEIRTIAPQDNIHIEFVRPEPTTWITDSSGAVLGSGSVEIDVGDPGERFTKTIVVWSHGLVGLK
ncbi:prepilin-type N-terminal cleavage/methylation domain-containing protein, partial [bacterium]|nr:prepilin-type N-terminal cleavage/methylation domain-containing protein [bacterium]